MGESRIGIVHGDAQSLSGWSFALEAMVPLDDALLQTLESACSSRNECIDREKREKMFQVTSTDDVCKWLDEAQVDCFACTHTCLPFAQQFELATQPAADKDKSSVAKKKYGVVINNGSAGMPNFRNMPGVGLITRIAALKPGQKDTHIPPDSLYGVTMGNLRIDAIAVHYDHNKWLDRFSQNWPQNSPAYESYYQRIVNGTELSLAQAARRGFHLTEN